MMRTANAARRALAIGGLLLLCLIWAWDSLRGEMLPGSPGAANFPTLQVEAMLLGLFAGVAGTAALIRKEKRPERRELRAAVLTGLGLFTAPSLITEWSRDWIGASTRVALTSLAPIFAVVFEPYLGDENEPEQRHGFAAAMVALAGTLMVFPIDLPPSAGGGFALVGVVVSAACVAAANCLGVRIAKAGSGFRFAAMTAGSSAVILAALGALRPNAVRVVDSWSALDVVALAVLFWLMGRMSAARMTTRFVIAPLLANLIGIAVVRPGVDLRGWAGLGLIAIGSGWMLLRPEEMKESIRIGLPAE